MHEQPVNITGSPENTANTLFQELGQSGYADVTAIDSITLPDTNISTAPEETHGNTSTVTLRRSARIPKTWARESYPGAIK